MASMISSKGNLNPLSTRNNTPDGFQMLSSRNSNPLMGKKLEMEKKTSPKDRLKMATTRYNNKKNLNSFRETEYKSPTNKLLIDEPKPKHKSKAKSIHRSVMNVFAQGNEITTNIKTEYIANTQGVILLTAPHSVRLVKAYGEL